MSPNKRQKQMRDQAQAEILRFLENWEPAYPPTVREVAAGVGRSVDATHSQLVHLLALGRVTWEAGQVRTLRLVKNRSET